MLQTVAKYRSLPGYMSCTFTIKALWGKAIPARLNKKRSADDKLTLSEFAELRTHLYDCALR